MLVECLSGVFPCALDDQQAITALTLEHLAQLGFTGSTVLHSVAFGFALVLGPSLLAVAVRAAVRTIKTL